MLFEIKTYFMDDSQDRMFIKNNLDIIWNILQEGYINKGGFKGIQGKSEFFKKVSMVKLWFLNGNIVAVDIYNDYLGGNKSIGLSCVKGDDHEPGVLLVKMIIKENITKWNDYIWAEVSGRVEDLYRELGGYNVKNEYVNIYLNGRTVELLDDGYHYLRMIGGEKLKKTIFGIKDKDVFETMIYGDLNGLEDFLKNKDDGFVNEHYKNNDYFKKQSPIELSIQVIYSFNSYHENYGYNEFPQHLYDKLKENVVYLQKMLKTKKCPDNMVRRVRNAVDTGLLLLKKTTPIIYMKF